MAVPDVHPIRGTAGTARGASAVRSNEGLDDNTREQRGRGAALENLSAKDISGPGDLAEKVAEHYSAHCAENRKCEHLRTKAGDDQGDCEEDRCRGEYEATIVVLPAPPQGQEQGEPNQEHQYVCDADQPKEVDTKINAGRARRHGSKNRDESKIHKRRN